MRKVAGPFVVLMVIAGAVALAPGAERKEPAKVSFDRLLNETQTSAEPTKGMNLVWFIPREFWEVSLAAEPTLTDEGRKEVLDVMSEVFIVGMIRADIGPFGAFKFHREKPVREAMALVYVDAEGGERTLKPTDEVSEDVAGLLRTMRPMLASAMGQMGQHFHFFVFDDVDEAGKRIVSPLVDGELRVKMKRLGDEAGGTTSVRFPLDSLFVPRACANCEHEAHIRWHYCPMCGEKLPE